jgi:hypothetical protein
LGPSRRGRSEGFFFRPSGRSRGTDDGRIDQPQVTVDQSRFVQAEQQDIEDGGPGAILTPEVEAVVNGLPGAIAFGQIAPGGAGMQMPENAVDHPAMVSPRVSGVVIVVGIGKERSNARPLRVGEFVAMHR